jgi:hypothetical protein
VSGGSRADLDGDDADGANAAAAGSIDPENHAAGYLCLAVERGVDAGVPR